MYFDTSSLQKVFMKLVVDENISFAKEAFATLGDVRLCHGRKITNEMLCDTEALIVRSVTNVNESLLKDTPVKFVGTATIGTDHIDKTYLAANGITFAAAAGCNSHAVKEYVFTAIFNMCVKHNISIKEKSIGIIGCGNIGSKVAEVAGKLGLKVYKNDPPLQRKRGTGEYCSLDEALQCDIVTCHVPLNKGGIDNTIHLLDESKLNVLKPGAILINTSRGPVIDNLALKQRLKSSNDLHVVLDVWETEPYIDTGLLALIELGSAHIAGYSLEGKVNGTTLIYNALCNHLQQQVTWKPTLPDVKDRFLSIRDTQSPEEYFFRLFNIPYPIDEDDMLLRQTLSGNIKDIGKYFDSLRKKYRLRRELHNYVVDRPFVGDSFTDVINILRIPLAGS